MEWNQRQPHEVKEEGKEENGKGDTFPPPPPPQFQYQPQVREEGGGKGDTLHFLRTIPQPVCCSGDRFDLA